MHLKGSVTEQAFSWKEHRMNMSIREKLQVEEQWLENVVRRKMLKYFGHLKKSERLGKSILEGSVKGQNCWCL